MASDKIKTDLTRRWPTSGLAAPGSEMELHRTLPHSIEAEQGVLSSMFQSADVIAKCDDRISTRFFYVPAHQTIFAKMVSVWRSGIPLDLITFTQILRDCNQLEEIGGAAFITSIFTFVPSAENVDQYLEIVRDKYRLRQVIEVCTQSAARAFDEQGEVDELLAQAQEKICAIDSKSDTKKRSTREVVSSVMSKMDSPEEFFGLSTGLKTIDEKMGGFAEGAQIVLAGAISGGKSSLAQLFAESLAVTRGIPTVIFTFEMTEEQTIQRIIQIRSEISASRIVRGEAEMFEVQSFMHAAEEVAKAPLTVISQDMDVAGINAKIAQIRPRIAIWDYLQIIPERRQKGESTTDKLDRMGASGKQMARRFGITNIVLSQLNKDDETYGSSMLTAHADNLLVIRSDEEQDDSKPIADKSIKIAKQRDGGKPMIYLSFVKAITKFKERKK